MIRLFDKALNNLSGVYGILSVMDARLYVGSAIRFRKRYNSHLSTLRQGKHRNSKLQRFFDKHGEEALAFVVLEVCEVDVILEREQFFIDLLNPDFNICEVAGNTLGRPTSEETKTKIGTANRGRVMPEWSQGRREEHAERMRNRSEETRKRLSTSKSVPVAQYDLSGKFLRTYPSAKVAAQANGVSNRDISACCHGGKKDQALNRVGQYQWRFYLGDDSDIGPYTHYGASAGVCKRGHEFTPDNTYTSPKGIKACRTCIRLAKERYEERHKQ